MAREAARRRQQGLGRKAVISEKAVGRSTSWEHCAGIDDDARGDEDQDGTRGFHDDAVDDFEREPWAVTHRAWTIDFTAVLFHATWGDSAAERFLELQHARDAFSWFQDRDPEENDTVLMGNFDRTREQAGWGPLLPLGTKLLVAGGGPTVASKGTRTNLYDQVVIDPRQGSRAAGEGYGRPP